MERINLIKYVSDKGWLDQLNQFFEGKYGVTFEEILKDQNVEVYNVWSNLDKHLPEGRCYFKENRVVLQDTSLCGVNPHIDLGLIVHELSHIAQYVTGLYNKLNYSVAARIWNCNCFRSKDHKHNFYWNNQVEVDARKSVKEFEGMFGYTELSGK